MRHLLFILFLSISSIVGAQGLNIEIGFNNDFAQLPDAMVAYEEFTYLLRTDFQDVSQSSHLTKMDTSGQILWEVEIEPTAAEIIEPKNIVISENGGVYLSGEVREMCDVGGNCFWFLQKIESNGTEAWTKLWPEISCASLNRTSLALTEDSIVSMTTSYNGQMLVRNVTVDGFQAPNTYSGNTHYGFLEKTTLYSIGAAGNAVYNFGVDTIYTSSQIQGLKVLNDTMYLLSKDSIFQYSNDAQLIASEGFPGNLSLTALDVRDNDLGFVGVTGTDITVFQMDHNLQILGSLQVPLDDSDQFVYASSESHVSAVRAFNLSEWQTIQYLDYSLVSGEDAIVDRTDVGVTNLYITQVNATPHAVNPSVFNLSVSGDAVITNFGSDTLYSVRINSFISQGIACGYAYYSEDFSGFELLPGDSMVFSLGIFFSEYNFFNLGSSVIREFCPYTSHPNAITDLTVFNDQYCETFALGVASLLESTLSDKQVYKMYDLLGREIEKGQGEIVIIRYTDGSTEKVFVTD